MDTIVYAARLKNNIDLEKSSSGGVYINTNICIKCNKCKRVCPIGGFL